MADEEIPSVGKFEDEAPAIRERLEIPEPKIGPAGVLETLDNLVKSLLGPDIEKLTPQKQQEKVSELLSKIMFTAASLVSIASAGLIAGPGSMAAVEEYIRMLQSAVAAEENDNNESGTGGGESIL